MATAVLPDDDLHANANDKHLEIFCLIWLDAHVKVKETRDTEKKLRSIINHVKKFQDVKQCQQYIEQCSQKDRLVLIVSGRLGREIVPTIHKLRQVTSIYVYCLDKKTNEQWASEFIKVKAVVVKLDELIFQIKTDHKIRLKIQEPLSINIFTTSTGAGKSTTGLNGEFVFFQVLIDCLLRLQSTETDRNELIKRCKQAYYGNEVELENIREFEQNYSSNKVLWWYTRETFFYRILNKALRVQDIDMIFLLRVFIIDIYRQLQHNQAKSPLRVYRSQTMSCDELKILKECIGQFISVNSFFSTSTDYSKAVSFLDDSYASHNLERVLFEIHADPKMVTTKPFADISVHSDLSNELEVLFMLGSIFRLNSINRNDDQIWIIRLTLCSDDEHALKQVLMHMKQETGTGETNLRTFGKILWMMGKLDLAAKYFMRLLNELPSTDPLLSSLYEDLGELASQKGDYDMSIEWRQKSLAYKKQSQSTADFSIKETNTSIPLNLDQCLNWSCEDVCKWVISLGKIYVTYVDGFKQNNVDGFRLLHFVDHDDLIEFGVNSSHNRRVILHGIKQLRESCSVQLTSDTATNNKDFYSGFVGDFVPPVQLTDSTFPNTMSCILKPHQNTIHSKLYNQILNWLGPLPNKTDIDRIELIHNADLYRMFLQRIKLIEGGQTEDVFQPSLDKETNPAERKKVLDLLQTLTQQVQHNRSAPVVRVWHGCDRTTVPKLLSNGFAALSKLDNGWFGTAIYFTSSAEYATKYTNSNGCLIMCYVVLLNPFPVITDDAPPGISSKNFRFYGRGNYSSYQSHYIPVAPVNENTSWNFRPPPGGVQDAVYDELAVFQQSDILPQVVVHLKPRSNTSATVDSKDNFAKKFLSKD